MGCIGSNLDNSTKLRMPGVQIHSQTVGAKLHWSKGKEPGSQSKVPKYSSDIMSEDS